MFNERDESAIRELRIEFKVKWLEKIIKDFIKEALIENRNEQRQIFEETKPLMKIVDISKRFKVSKQTIHNWINRGIITGNKTGKNRYFTEEEVRNALTKYGHNKYE